jgi:hypothetical protein
VNSELVPADELVVQPRDLQPGDEIVGIQKSGRSDVVAARSGRIVDVGVGEHRTGGECIQLRWRQSPGGPRAKANSGQSWMTAVIHERPPHIA